MATLPRLKVIRHATIDPSAFLPREFFTAHKQLFCGVQFPPFGEYEFAWDEDDLGRWNAGFGSKPVLGTPVWSRPENMNIVGGTRFDIDRDPINPVYRLAASTGPMSADGDTTSSSMSSGSSGTSSLPVNRAEERITWGAAQNRGSRGWTEVTASWTTTDTEKIDWPATYEWVVYDTMSGEAMAGGTIRPADKSLKNSVIVSTPVFLPSGSYVFWAHITEVNPAYRLPPGYTPVEAYRYTENEESYIYDPFYNIGRIPGKDANETGQDLLERRRSILKSNSQTDKPEWAIYLTSSESQEGEWSVVRFVVGEGDFEVGSDVIASRNPALYKIYKKGDPKLAGKLGQIDTYYGVAAPVPFDYLSRQVSASYRMIRDLKSPSGTVLLPEGTELVAGARATQTGTCLALWVLNPDGTGILLGTNPDESTGACECAMLEHAGTDIEQDDEGNVYVLSKCALFVYEPSGAETTQRLVGSPTSNGEPNIDDSRRTVSATSTENGHPGGRTLRNINGAMFYFTESFGFSVPGSINFYNYMITQVGQNRIKGPGTVAHVDCEAERWMGALWGIQQSAALDNPDAMQYITWYDGWRWALSNGQAASGIMFPASEFRWQRLRAMNNKLFVFGKDARNENAIAGVMDGQRFQQLTIDYRIRRITVGPASNPKPGFEESLYTFGRDMTKLNSAGDNFFELPWELIEITGEVENVVFRCCSPSGEDSNCCCVSLGVMRNLGVLEKDLPSYLICAPTGLKPAQERPTDPYQRYLSLRVDLSYPATACYCLAPPPPGTFVWDDYWPGFVCDNNNLGDVDYSELPKFLVYSSEANDWVPREETLTGEAFTTPYLVRLPLNEANKVVYQVGADVEMPYEAVCEGEFGNAINFGVDTWPIYSWCSCDPCEGEGCSLLVFNPMTGEFSYGQEDENGEIVPCACPNAAMCRGDMPEGTTFQTFFLPAETTPINSFQVTDVGYDLTRALELGFSQEKIDEIFPEGLHDQSLVYDRERYKTLWYRARPLNEPYPDLTSGTLEERIERENVYLANFTRSIDYNRVHLLSKPCSIIIEVLVLVPPDNPGFAAPFLSQTS